MYGNDLAVRIPLHVLMEHLADCPERNHHPPVDDLGRHVETIRCAIKGSLLGIVVEDDLAGPVIDGDSAVVIPLIPLLDIPKALATARIGIMVRPLMMDGCTSKLT